MRFIGFLSKQVHSGHAEALATTSGSRSTGSHPLYNISAADRNLIKLPNFPSAGRDLLDQYARTFEKAITHAPQIAAALRG